MADNNPTQGPTGGIAVLVGALALVAVFFMLTGGGLGGKTTVQGDADMPPIATGAKAP